MPNFLDILILNFLVNAFLFLRAPTLPSCHIEKLFKTHSTKVKYERDGRQMGERERGSLSICTLPSRIVHLPNQQFIKSRSL